MLDPFFCHLSAFVVRFCSIILSRISLFLLVGEFCQKLHTSCVKIILYVHEHEIIGQLTHLTLTNLTLTNLTTNNHLQQLDMQLLLLHTNQAHHRVITNINFQCYSRYREMFGGNNIFIIVTTRKGGIIAPRLCRDTAHCSENHNYSN